MRIVLFFSICLFFKTSFCQNVVSNNIKWTDIEKTQMGKGELFFIEKQYRIAFPVLEKLYMNHSDDLHLKYMFAASALSIPGKQLMALKLLKEVKAKKWRDIDLEYYLAKANFLNYNFDEALLTVNYYFSKLKNPTTAQKKKYDELLNYCTNAKQLIKNPVPVKIENMGNIINTDAAEYYPNVSDDESLIIFTYKGLKSKGGLQDPFNRPNKSGIYYEDVFSSVKENGVWKTPSGIKDINTVNNESALFLSNDRKKILINMDSDTDDGDIYSCDLENGVWRLPVKLPGDVNTSFWENEAVLSLDSKTLYYSSSKPGGFGGKDIYKSNLLPNGNWSVGQNLGKEINTSLDEDSPFIHYDGKLLLFSSKGHNSMGGYDVFKSYSLIDSSWTTPENMGYPINTPDDDNHYILSSSGEVGYYSLGKPDGYGDLDIYKVTPGIVGTQPVIAMLKGTVLCDSIPVEVEITVEKKVGNNVFRTFKSDKTTGVYNFILPVGEDYKITWKLDNSSKQTDVFEASNVLSYVVKEKDLHFTRKKDTSLINISNTVNVISPCNTPSIPDFSSLKGKSLNEPEVYKQFLNLGGNLCIDGLVFKVQVAAYKHPENFKYDHLKQFGSPEIVKYPDGITRFTQFSMSTINEAELSRQKVINSGQKDAWIVAFFDGKRFTLEELISLNFNFKAIN